jgi:nucleotide-binding universal stress UspA family protein
MKKIPQTLLVPVDFSDVTASVLDAAQTLALAFKSRVVLLHLVEPEPDFVGFEAGPATVRSSVAKEFREEHKHLEEAKQQLEKAGVNVCALQIQGPTVAKILDEAGRQNADMILIGSHGHGALYHLFAGDVAAGILKDAKCPVLVVPSREA